MLIEILICTIDDGIRNVERCLMPRIDSVAYVVSWQQTTPRTDIPVALRKREDVRVVTLEGRGLSRNRNNAIRNSCADILIISDDDCRFTAEGLEKVRKAYEKYADASVICFRSVDYSGKPMHPSPDADMTYADAMNRGYYAISIEMTLRGSDFRVPSSSRAVPLVRFNERFGLGSGMYNAGEEEIFMADVRHNEMKAMFVPEVIVASEADNTGIHFAESVNLQQTKGAVFRYVYGLPEALWRSVKEGLWYLVHKHRNPFPIIFNMVKGIIAK